jgi:hypothetical protein
VGFPLITYNSKTINFPDRAYRLQIDSPRHMTSNRSASGFAEDLKIRADVQVDVGFRWFPNASTSDFKRQLKQWHVWAQEGRAWNFGIDSTDTVFTTLSASAAAGATVLSLATMTGVAVDGLYIVRNTLDLEVVKVTALNTPGAGQVTIADPLNFSYFLGDRFRSERVWPGRLLSNENPIVDHPAPNHIFWDFELRFSEDVNLL